MNTKLKGAAITLSVLGIGLFSQQLDANAMGVSNLKDSNPEAYQKMADEDKHAKIKGDSVTKTWHQKTNDMEPSDRTPNAFTSFAYTPGVPTISITDKSRPRTDAVDISSNNGTVSIDSFKQMKRYGVKTIIIKATEFNTYRNPLARQQMANAKAAGLNVMFYHYDWFSNQTEARREANYFADYLDTLGINKNTKVFDDLEEGYTKTSGITGNVQAFRDQLSKRGYKNSGTYTFEGLIQSTNINTTALNRATVWNAQYPYNPLASSLWQTDKGAWQFSSAMTIPGVPGKFDASIDYKNLLVEKPASKPAPKPSTPSKSSSSSAKASSAKSSSIKSGAQSQKNDAEKSSSKTEQSSSSNSSQSASKSSQSEVSKSESSSQVIDKHDQTGNATDKSKVKSSKTDNELKEEADKNVDKDMIDNESPKSDLKRDDRPDVKAYEEKQSSEASKKSSESAKSAKDANSEEQQSKKLSNKQDVPEAKQTGSVKQSSNVDKNQDKSDKQDSLSKTGQVIKQNWKMITGIVVVVLVSLGGLFSLKKHK